MKNAVKTKILFVLENYIDHHASIPPPAEVRVTPIRGTVCFGKQYHFIKKISNQLLAHLVTVM